VKKFIILSLLIIQSCSYHNPFTVRISKDHIPINEIGRYWIYKNNNGIQKYVEVKKTTNWDGKEAILIEENYQESYWYKGNGYVSRHRNIEINYNGELFPVEYRWQNYIEIPILQGNNWENSWMDTTFIYDKPLIRTSELKGKVECYETMETEAGIFENCYRIKISTVVENLSSLPVDSIISKTYYEWYAPDVGLVKTTEDNKGWTLIKYGLKEAGN
jgi:hypothetical protein